MKKGIDLKDFFKIDVTLTGYREPECNGLSGRIPRPGHEYFHKVSISTLLFPEISQSLTDTLNNFMEILEKEQFESQKKSRHKKYLELKKKKR